MWLVIGPSADPQRVTPNRNPGVSLRIDEVPRSTRNLRVISSIRRMFEAADGGPHEGRVFAQPWWLRGMNIVAAAVLAGLAIAVIMSGPMPSLVAAPIAGTLACACMLFGVGAMRSQVTVTSESVHYRGSVRSHDIALSQLVDFRSSSSWTARLAGQVPCIVWRGADGSTQETVLWCLPLTRGAEFGIGSTEEITENLRVTLQPFIRRNA